MIFFLLLSLFFYHDVFGSFTSVSSVMSKQINDRPQSVQLHSIAFTGKAFYPFIRNSYYGGAARNETTNKELENFREIQNTVSSSLSEGVYGYKGEGVRLFFTLRYDVKQDEDADQLRQDKARVPFQEKRYEYGNKLSQNVDSEPFVKASTYYKLTPEVDSYYVNSKKFNRPCLMLEDDEVVFVETKATDSTFRNLTDLLAANVYCQVSRGANIAIPVCSQEDFDFMTENLLNKLPAGTPIKFDVTKNVLAPLHFSNNSLQKTARLVVGYDTKQTFNVFTFIHSLKFVSHGKTLYNTLSDDDAIESIIAVVEKCNVVFTEAKSACDITGKPVYLDHGEGKEFKLASKNPAVQQIIDNLPSEIAKIVLLTLNMQEINKTLKTKNKTSQDVIENTFFVLSADQSSDGKIEIDAALKFAKDCLREAKKVKTVEKKSSQPINAQQILNKDKNKKGWVDTFVEWRFSLAVGGFILYRYLPHLYKKFSPLVFNFIKAYRR